MRSHWHSFVLVLALHWPLSSLAQADGDHPVTNGVSGITYLATDANVGAGATQPDGFTVGTTANNAAAFVVEGAQMANPTGEVFRTYGSNNAGTYWRMFRRTSGSVQQVGHIYCPGTNDANLELSARLASLRLKANDVTYFQLYSGSASTINGYSGIDPDGFLGLSGRLAFFTSTSSPGPFSRLHLVDDSGTNSNSVYAPTLGFRPWMRNGITITGNADQMYVGHKYGTSDGLSQAVVQWSEGTLDADRQSLRFIFTTTPTSGTGAVTTDGLEIMRLWPESNTSGYVGIGDFATASASPSERLDLLDKTIRLRDFTGTTYQNDSYDRVLVVNPSDGRMYWRAASTLGAPGCQWTMTSTTANPNHVYTAAGSSSATCPDAGDAVGIGLVPSSPNYKLGVSTSNFANGVSITNSTTTSVYPGTIGAQITTSGGGNRTLGLDINTTQANGYAGNLGMNITAASSGAVYSPINWNYGLSALVTGKSWLTRGVTIETNCGTGVTMDSEVAGEFWSRGNADHTYGLWSKLEAGVASAIAVRGEASSNAAQNEGVSGQASGTEEYVYYGVHGYANSTNTNATVRGVLGKASTAGAQFWSIYSEGDEFSTSASPWSASDENLKENIQDLSGGLQAILQLQPKSYNFRTDEFDYVSLPQGPQLGLLAQDVEAVLPQMVRTVRRPADMDSSGNEIHPELEFKAIQYGSLIPMLVAAMKEQNATVTALQQQVADAQPAADQMAAMQEQIQAMQQQMALLQEQLAACCAGGMVPPGDNELRNGLESVTGNARSLTIQPNPFNERTTLYYTLERAGRMQLIANSTDGKQLRVLAEANKEAGQYQMEWMTADLAPGIYYVTLLLDGEPIVKRAVKVGH